MVGRLYHLGRPRSRARAEDLLARFDLTRGRRPHRAHVLRRNAAPPRPRRRAGGAAAGAVPRRAHDRSRPAQPPEHVGDHRGLRRRRYHRAPHHPVPGRGRPPRRPDRRDRPRSGDRGGDVRRVEGPRRRRGAGDRCSPIPPRRRCRGHGARIAGRRAGNLRAGAAARADPPPRRRDRRRGQAPGRGRHRDRRHRGPPADARRRLHGADRPRRRGGAGLRRSAAGRRRSRDRAALRRLGHGGNRAAQPAADPARTRPADLVHGAADHVRAAVRVRLRWGDQHAGLRLRGLPDARASSRRRWRSVAS